MNFFKGSPICNIFLILGNAYCNKYNKGGYVLNSRFYAETIGYFGTITIAGGVFLAVSNSTFENITMLRSGHFYILSKKIEIILILF